MKVIVYPHDLDMGGSQMNAIEIAAAVRDLGVEATIFGRPGALNGRIAELGLEFVEAPEPRHRPSRAVAEALRATARRRGASVLHGYEWPPALECYMAAAADSSSVAVSTVMSMSVAPFIPGAMPLLVGTEQIAAAERASGRSEVAVLEPPVDLRHNVHPPSAEVAGFRQRYGVGPSDFLIVCVTRFARELKAEGLFTAIAATAQLPPAWRVKLVLFGDGPARDELRKVMADANRRAGHEVVVMPGPVSDPRPAYAAADVVLGMGGSALRALAFEKPLIVQGERGFFALLDERSMPTFLWQGWYGVGADAADGSTAFTDAVARLIADPGLRSEVAATGHRLVTQRFSLTAAAQRQVEFYAAAVRSRRSTAWTLGSGIRSIPAYARYQGAKKLRRALGSNATDDFNSNPVATANNQRGSAQASRETLVYLGGVDWDGVLGTDRRLVAALAMDIDVVWVDPPIPLTSWLRARSRRAARETKPMEVPGVSRLSVTVPPGVTRPLSRNLARIVQRRSIEAHIRSRGIHPTAVVVAYSGSDFPAIPGVRCLHLTDDWIAGASMMGTSASWTTSALRQLVRHADLVCAVSPALLDHPQIPIPDRVSTLILPNGCDPQPELVEPRPAELSEPYAILIGQLNERLDIAAILATVDAGLPVVIAGPRADREPRVSRQFDELLAHERVTWLGRRAPAEFHRYLSHAEVGLTPYLDTAFNRSSFPLKTLEYLAAGLPVVSSDLPATRWLASPDVYVAQSAREFACLARDASRIPHDAESTARRQSFASMHSWDRRADDLLRTIKDLRPGTLVTQPGREVSATDRPT